MTPDARLLCALRQARGASLLPSELSAAIALPAEEIAARVAEMNAAGYEIELSPHLGYRLCASPDRLIGDDIASRLSLLGEKRESWQGALQPHEPHVLGREILVFEETASTNDVATRLARSGVAEGVVIFAERQTAGRGRLGRKWDSAAHQGLWFSILLRPENIGLPAQHWAQLTTWAAVGVARALEASLHNAAEGVGSGWSAGIRAGIKWPNDIHLQGRKAVGILIESGSDATGGYAVAGIGVNVNQLAFPDELQAKATSMRLALRSVTNAEEQGAEQPALDRMEVAASILYHLDTLYHAMGGKGNEGKMSERSGFEPILAEAERRSVLVGQWIEVQTPHGQIQGMAEGLNPDGTLRLRRADGALEHLSGGEVSVARW